MGVPVSSDWSSEVTVLSGSEREILKATPGPFVAMHGKTQTVTHLGGVASVVQLETDRVPRVLQLERSVPVALATGDNDPQPPTRSVGDDLVNDDGGVANEPGARFFEDLTLAASAAAQTRAGVVHRPQTSGQVSPNGLDIDDWGGPAGGRLSTNLSSEVLWRLTVGPHRERIGRAGRREPVRPHGRGRCTWGPRPRVRIISMTAVHVCQRKVTI